MRIIDHNDDLVRHGRAYVNGVRLHYMTAGEGDPVLLLHGVPKTSYHWRHVIPLLTPHHRVVVPDMRGLGDSQHTPDGYDMRNVGEDFAQLMSELGHDRFRLVGEDWGAAAAYQLAAAHPDRVQQLVYQEMILPGYGLEDYSFLTAENVRSFVWLWHINFYSVPEFPEMLIGGLGYPSNRSWAGQPLAMAVGPAGGPASVACLACRVAAVGRSGSVD